MPGAGRGGERARAAPAGAAAIPADVLREVFTFLTPLDAAAGGRVCTAWSGAQAGWHRHFAALLRDRRRAALRRRVAAGATGAGRLAAGTAAGVAATAGAVASFLFAPPASKIALWSAGQLRVRVGADGLPCRGADSVMRIPAASVPWVASYMQARRGVRELREAGRGAVALECDAAVAAAAAEEGVADFVLVDGDGGSPLTNDPLNLVP